MADHAQERLPPETRGPNNAFRYPASASAQSQWIVAHRPKEGRNKLDPFLPHAFLAEQERDGSGEILPTAVLFLTNRECPWRCLMCDLWQNTLDRPGPPGAIPAQIDHALMRLPPARQIKLYNSGSFFDRAAVPPEDHPAIAERLKPFQRTIVECHPALVDKSALRFRDLLPGKLEVAIGLETAHPEILSRLNKRTTLEQIRQAATFLLDNKIDVRMFVLIQPPFSDSEAPAWTQRTVEFAFDSGAGAVSLIPTRAGNGAMESLASQGCFSPPTLTTIEAAFARALRTKRGRVFLDLWNLEEFSDCPECFAARQARLHRMNLSQELLPEVTCAICRGAHP